MIATVGSYPRDDVWSRWVDDGRVRSGVARLYGTDAPPPYDDRVLPLGRLELGELDTVVVDRPVGSVFTVVIEGRYDAGVFTRTVALRLTGDEDDVAEAFVGPGLIRQPRRLHRLRYGGFQFGITALGAAPVNAL